MARNWYKQASGSDTGILVPGYVYPSSGATGADYLAFFALVDQYPTVPIYFIVNPDDGPGITTNASYQTLINKLVSRRITVLGYSFTEYGTRPIAEVKAEIDAYEELYNGVTGIFLDEMSTANNQTIIDYYVELTTHCHANGKSYVIGNCGTKPNEKYFLNATADNILIFEDSAVPTEAQLQCAYSGRIYPSYKKSVLVHSQASYDADLMKLCADNCGLVYITEDVMANPWDTFSAYMENMLEYLSNQNDATANYWENTNW